MQVVASCFGFSRNGFTRLRFRRRPFGVLLTASIARAAALSALCCRLPMESVSRATAALSTTTPGVQDADEPLTVAYVTAPPDRAEDLAAALVESELVACVNIVPGLTSVYRWKGKIEKDGESLLIIKTRASLQSAVTAWVRAHHPYETPEVIFLPVEAGNPAYLAWVRDSTAGAPSGAGGGARLSAAPVSGAAPSGAAVAE